MKDKTNTKALTEKEKKGFKILNNALCATGDF